MQPSTVTIAALLLSSLALTSAFFTPATLITQTARPSALSPAAGAFMSLRSKPLGPSLALQSAKMSSASQPIQPPAAKKTINPFAKFALMVLTVFGLCNPAFAWKSTPLEPTPAQAIEKTYQTPAQAAGQHIYIARGQGAAELLEAAEVLDKATEKTALNTWKKRTCKEILEMPTQTRVQEQKEGMGGKLIHALNAFAAPLLVLWIPNMIVVPWYLLLNRSEDHRRWRKFIIGADTSAPNKVQRFSSRFGM